ncbi:hypothetical protein SAMN05421810_10120 [Amycolatopsis arida]|uniref:DUF6801 domain-containing protein n=1 Tax=Amycolatopsis arida TaxID=587909 RepID=A0A1I5K720_9PSEU|nr:DUF6801 domain-containing protein [Amycolatopsis arida]TDX96916.1 hypothetical protein CLV69_10218 [Amycolatopsis arida]SFO80874.1 hypothetical protein SAMN05421810_10120 [Amycolatopsis arida]
MNGTRGRASRGPATGTAVLALAAGLAGGLTGAGSTASGQADPPTVTALDYACDATGGAEPTGTKPTGTEPTGDPAMGEPAGDLPGGGPVPVRMTVTAGPLPPSVPAGQPVRLDRFAVRLALPEEAWRGITGPATATIDGTATVPLAVRRDDEPDQVPVDLVLPATPAPESGPLTLAGEGAVPPLHTGAAALLELAVEPPTLALTPRDAEGDPTVAHPVELRCRPHPDHDPRLGAVAVELAGPGTPAPSTSPPGEPGESGAAPDSATPHAGPEALAGAARDPRGDPRALITPQFIVGESTVAKLNETFALGTGIFVNGGQFLPPPYIRGSAGMPPARTPFAAFGFMPTTGKAEFLPADQPDGKFVTFGGPNPMNVLEGQMRVIIKLGDVAVNGVPLDVGPNCRTAAPVVIDVIGTYFIFSGGTLGTDPEAEQEKHRGFTIPPFTGCGVTESLDPLVTGLVSGPDNQLTLTLTTVR